MSANLENSAVAMGLEKISFLSNSKERQCQRMCKLPYNYVHFTCSKVMLKILQARLQQYVNQELPDVHAGFRKVRGTQDQIANILSIMEEAREFQTNICFIDYAKAFVWSTTNCGKLKEMGVPVHLTCLLRNLYAGQEAIVRTLHGTTDWLKIGKGVWQGCILPSAYLTCMQSTSCEMPGWMNHKLESRLPEEISTSSDMQTIPF